MRPSTLKTIAILLITISAWGQTTIRGTTSISSDGVISDTINRSPNRGFEKRINLGPIELSNFEFEIRFYRLTTVTNKRNVRLLRFNAGQWESLEYDENNKAKIKTYYVTPKDGFEIFMTSLTKYNFTSLPDQSNLDKQIQDSFATKKEYLQSRPSIMDGYEFTVEFKIGDKFRIYRFHNPESYAKYYDNVEWRNYVSIQKLFEKDLVRK